MRLPSEDIVNGLAKILMSWADIMYCCFQLCVMYFVCFVASISKKDIPDVFVLFFI